MAAREAYSRRGSARPCLGPADESSSARLSRALRGTAGGGAVPPQMGPYHPSRSLPENPGRGDERGPAARRRPMAAREAYSLYVERAGEGANEADGPFSSTEPLLIEPHAGDGRA